MKKKILPIGLGFILIFLISAQSYSQNIYFCTRYDDEGYPLNSEYSWYCDNGYTCTIYCIVRSYSYIPTYSVKYEIYKYNSMDKEYHYQTTDYGYFSNKYNKWFAKELKFYKDGLYKVTVYDNNNNYVTSGIVRMNFN